jgi:serine O-acetyltransferase
MITAVHLYRGGHWFYVHHVPILPRFVYAVDYLFFNASVPASAEIDKGVRFEHSSMGAIIHRRAVAGENCIFGNQVTVRGRSHILDRWVQRGCLAQVNASNLDRGRDDNLAQDLMDRGLVACTATDAHDAVSRLLVILHHSFADLKLS